MIRTLVFSPAKKWFLVNYYYLYCSVSEGNISLHFQTFILPLIVIIESDNSQLRSDLIIIQSVWNDMNKPNKLRQTKSRRTVSMTSPIVMTRQRRVDPLAAIFIRQNQSGNGQRAEQEYQRQSRDVNNTRQGSRSQAQVQSSKVGQSGVKHRDSRMNNAQKCQPGQEQDFAVSACESAA